MTATGSMDDTKAQLLLQVKREAIGELITSFSVVNDFELAADSIAASSAGFVRIKRNPIYSNGANLGDVCVQIHAYVTEQDRNKFKSVKIATKQCASDSNLTVKAIKKYAEEQVVVSSLYNYNRKLDGYDKEKLLALAHHVKYLESGFIPDTETYCVKYKAIIYPIEILALLNSSPIEAVGLIKNVSERSEARTALERKKRVYLKDKSKLLALGDTTRGSRFNAISQILDTLSQPLSLKEMNIIMDGIAEYRANAVDIIAKHLPKNLRAKELKVLLGDATRGSRYKIIATIAPKFARPINLEELSVMMEGTEEYRANAVGVIANKLAKKLSVSELHILLEGSERGSRYNIISDVVQKLSRPINQDTLLLLLEGIGEYRTNTLQLINN